MYLVDFHYCLPAYFLLCLCFALFKVFNVSIKLSLSVLHVSVMGFCVASLQRGVISASDPRPAAAALQERVGAVERLVCLFP